MAKALAPWIVEERLTETFPPDIRKLWRRWKREGEKEQKQFWAASEAAYPHKIAELVERAEASGIERWEMIDFVMMWNRVIEQQMQSRKYHK